MDTITITQVHDHHWFVASMVMLSGKIYTGIGETKEIALDHLIESFNKEQNVLI
jgi:hypothetical protein